LLNIFPRPIPKGLNCGKEVLLVLVEGVLVEEEGVEGEEDDNDGDGEVLVTGLVLACELVLLEAPFTKCTA
jgi:hypothetical protein